MSREHKIVSDSMLLELLINNDVIKSSNDAQFTKFLFKEIHRAGIRFVDYAEVEQLDDENNNISDEQDNTEEKQIILQQFNSKILSELNITLKLLTKLKRRNSSEQLDDTINLLIRTMSTLVS